MRLLVRFGLMAVHVKVSGGLRQLQFHSLHALVQHYLATEPRVLLEEWRHVQQVVLLFIGIVQLFEKVMLHVNVAGGAS